MICGMMMVSDMPTERGCDGVALRVSRVPPNDALLVYPRPDPAGPHWPMMDAVAIRDLTPSSWYIVLATREHVDELYERMQLQMIAHAVARRARWAELLSDMRRDLGADGSPG